MDSDALIAVKREMSARLLALEDGAALNPKARIPAPTPMQNVVGVGLAEKLVEDRLTGVMALTVFVRREYPKSRLRRGERLPETVDGLPVDVIPVGSFRAFGTGGLMPASAGRPNPRTDVDPAQPGSSVGYWDPFEMSAGTLGAVVVDSHGREYILSNNQVLAA